MSNNTLESALDLARQGMAVFPCVHGEKVPATGRGFYSATANAATIRRLFRAPRNIAVRTGAASGVWILDVDDPSALASLDPLPETRTSATSRGRHLWWRTPALSVPSSTGRVAPGIDVKGEGGYVIAPPSLHPDGTRYRWVTAPDAPIADAPSWLLTLARKPPAPIYVPPKKPRKYPAGNYGAAALKSEAEALAQTPHGSRNNQLNRASFALHQLVAGGELDGAAVEAALLEASIANGLAADDGIRSVMATIASGRRAGMASPRNAGGRA